MTTKTAATPTDPAQQVIELLTAAKKSIVTAESCTGGLVAAALTDVPGASKAFFGGYITYANDAKARMIHVQARLIRDYGAVSNQVARAMADGARNTAHADFAVAVTGIAGPDGGSEKKPVGLVYVAVSSELATVVIEHRFGDLGRAEIRQASVNAALDLVVEVLTGTQD
ncbi:CinA family protein [Devosia sp. J2-20]|jgi:nicotinamide-nucleotide amidase|uniref:CinA family protein n=1 Tax=Devosia litorisediminis TaxID=2829817 RepID=A0A942EBR8_9HYPH|nr:MULTISPECIES: CinA family protein [Devosia]MBS3848419.1 CinA family protein [Devosia litorisediminis]MCZ4345069.1 CinA family protein [Devosia neptuniae]WDQ98504.1 CinA family protein [Devosia sp. J2-20]|tara:strand:- start:879 stop:1388 length:510 start_codon:yes stop_codon:yes gene_type:complete